VKVGEKGCVVGMGGWYHNEGRRNEGVVGMGRG